MGEEQRHGGRRPRPARDSAVIADVLARLAAAERDHDVLLELATIAQEITGADDATVLVADDDGLVPVLTLGRPIRLDDRPVDVTTVDIRADDSMVLVPIAARGRVEGMLALDWREVPFERDDVRLLEAVAASAGVALASARLQTAERAAAERLGRARTPADVLAALRGWFDSLAGGGAVRAVAVLDGAARTVTCETGSGPLPEVVADVFPQVFGVGEVDAPGLLADLLGDGDGIARCLALPLRSDGGLVGGVVVGLTDATPFDAGEHDATGVVIGTAGAAVGRIAAERARMQADLREVAGQLLGALSLLARHHAEVLPAGSAEARTAHRLAELASAGRWSLDDDVHRLRGDDD